VELKMKFISDEGHKQQLSVLQGLTPEQRLLIAFELSENTRRIFAEGLRARFPDLSEQELRSLSPIPLSTTAASRAAAALTLAVMATGWPCEMTSNTLDQDPPPRIRVSKLTRLGLVDTTGCP